MLREILGGGAAWLDDWYPHGYHIEPDAVHKRIRQLTGSRAFRMGGEVKKYNQGGFVEGDSRTIRGQTVYYRGGKWVYKSGSPAPSYVVDAINAESVKETDKPSPMASETSSDTPMAPKEDSVELKESEAKHLSWARRMLNAEKVIRELEADPDFNPASLARSKERVHPRLTW